MTDRPVGGAHPAGSNDNGPLAEGSFRQPKSSLGSFDAYLAARVIGAAADIALVVDERGVIQDLSCQDVAAWRHGYEAWSGQSFIDVVTADSRGKVQDLLTEARSADRVRSREINHRAEDGASMPVRYSAVGLGDTSRVLAVGRDLRALSDLQKQLVQAQQAMEREYARLRHAETRYRLLFQIASEAVLIADASDFKVTEANPAAQRLLKLSSKELLGQRLQGLFEPNAWGSVQSMLASARVVGWADDVRTKLLESGQEVFASASLFRQEYAALFLVRLGTHITDLSPEAPRHAPLMEVVAKLPDGFVVVDDDRRVLTANAAFLDIIQLATEAQVQRESLERWLGRPGVDLNILMANLREHGTVRNFNSIVRGQYGTVEPVEVSGVAAVNGQEPCFGFVIRRIGPRGTTESTVARELPHSVEQLTELVGRVSLKEIIRETTDVIERLCIEAALEVSGDNRASAAQMLGLSRQSLYSKLRRHGIGDLDSGGVS
ncbi:MAG: transcriptional regulator PpsR [Myxococcota bacterium]